MPDIGNHGTCEVCGQRGKIRFYGNKRLCRFHYLREFDYARKDETPNNYQTFKTLIRGTTKEGKNFTAD